MYMLVYQKGLVGWQALPVSKGLLLYRLKQKIMLEWSSAGRPGERVLYLHSLNLVSSRKEELLSGAKIGLSFGWHV
jgi:hypothetical protein